MSDIATERAHLAQAERDIAEGQARIFRQEELIAELHRDGHDTATAEALLRNLRATMEQWVRHRDLILQAIGDLGG